MRILHLLSNHYLTGPAELVLALSRAQSAAGHRVSMIVDTFREGNLPDRVCRADIDLDRRLKLSVKAGLKAQLLDILALRKIWTSNEFDIVHSHKSHEHTLAMLARSRPSKTKLVRTLNKNKTNGIARAWQLRKTDGLVTVSARQKDELVGKEIVGSKQIVTVRSVVDSDEFCPVDDGLSLRSDLGVAPTAPTLGIVSRIKAGRGHRELLDAWLEVHRMMPAARLLISGRGELSNSVAQAASEPRYGGSIVVLGYQKNLVRFYRSLDVKIILSPGNDGTCRAAAQAMACGIPVIAPRVGALADMIEDQVTGFVPRSLEPSELSSCIVSALSNLKNLAQVGRAARTTATEDFTIEKHHKVVEDLYCRIIGP
jgi:glycosyltransferase involved in cell wall biosynthesis